MPALVAPPRHCIPDIGRKLTGDASEAIDELQPFACGMSGRSIEVLEPQNCDVQGVIPDWLQGSLYRNGPGAWDIQTKSGETFSMSHWSAHLLHFNKPCTGIYAAIDRLHLWSALQSLAYQVRHATLIFACFWAGLCGAAIVLIHNLPYFVGTGAACLAKLPPVPAGLMGQHSCTSLVLKQGMSHTAIGTW